MLGPTKEKAVVLPTSTPTLTAFRRGRRWWLYRTVVGLIVLSCAWLQLVFGGSWVSSSLDSSRISKENSEFDGLHEALSPVTTEWESNGLTKEVQWDKYSLNVMGQRVFIWSGEFHPWRLPVPALWPDILTKIKAMGMNAISVYIHWGISNPAPGVLDFEGHRDWQPFLDACKEAGLFVVFRPGPYINAETTAGGIPGWVTTLPTHLRTNSSVYHDAWKPYINYITSLAARNQVTNGGPIIAVQVENEYAQREDVGQPHKAEMMVQLEDAFRKNGVVVPLTHNDWSLLDNYASGKGKVDLYGIDDYPQKFDCSHPDVWRNVTPNYDDYHQKINPSQPFYVPEFQSGAFDPWGPAAPGYDACRKLTGPEFQTVFNLHLWENNAKLINLYMIYGGTSWGHLAFPGVYTSYDYAAPIHENRAISEKYTTLKLQGMFLRSSPEFYKTDIVGNSTHTNVVPVDNPAVVVTYLRNPDTQAGFYFARKVDSTSRTIERFSFPISIDSPLPNGSSVKLTHRIGVAPALSLLGRTSKLILTNYKFGQSRALYTTTSVYFAGRIGDRDVLFLHGDIREWHEAAVRFEGTPNWFGGSEKYLSRKGNVAGHTLISVMPGTKGLVTIWDSDKQLILYADTATAGTFWAPVISSPHSQSPFRNFWQFGSNFTALIGGPYLVRDAQITDRGELALTGDLKEEVMLTVIAPEGISSITWNGAEAGLVGQAATQTPSIQRIALPLRPRHDESALKMEEDSALLDWDTPPTLGKWRYANSLPETEKDYDDSLWRFADHTSTNSPYKPYFGDKDGPVLYACDYGFCEGAVLWRGHFESTGKETGVNLTINGGEAFAASVWLNGHFLGTTYGNSTNNENVVRETNQLFEFPKGLVQPGEDNVITVLQDNMGLDESENFDADTSKSPRGIRGYKLVPDSPFSSWRVQGKLGGYDNFPDRVRGILNEGGFFAERGGWHLPDFDTSSWTARDISDGLPHDQAGAGIFRTEFRLRIPDGFDVHMSFVFDNDFQPYRALLFVNGWQMGKRVANLGPQYKFPVPQGILNYRGKNTVAVIVWAMESDAQVRPGLRLEFDGIYDGGPGTIVHSNPGWTERT